MFVLAPVFAAALALLVSTAAVAGDASTTRIETRAFYGATVTLEHGVRVYRALPAHDRVIINPGGRTPVSLSIEESKSTSYNHFYDHSGGRAPIDFAPQIGHHGGYFAPHRNFSADRKFRHNGRLVPLHRRPDGQQASGDGNGAIGSKR